jgi:uncharacterized protein involved in oxidation of intracellular sulfur
MKKTFLILTILICSFDFNIHAQCGGDTKTTKPTSIGIVIYSNDIETVWNALRFANFSIGTGDTVKIFLLGKGVELDTLAKNNSNIKEQTDLFLHTGGIILGCGTCLQSRKNFMPQFCKMSSMSDLYDIVRKSKTVLTF